MGTVEEFVNRRYGRCAVADRKGDTLGATATTITGGEHTGQACFNRAWRPGFFPNGERGDVLAGQHETLVISHDGRGEEVGSGLCSDGERNMAAWPAELPPPTTWAAELRQSRASILVAL